MKNKKIKFDDTEAVKNLIEAFKKNIGSKYDIKVAKFLLRKRKKQLKE